MGTLLETVDVARALNLSCERIRQLANAGRIPVVAVTPRGTRLFDPDNVETFRRERALRASVLVESLVR
jgi:DNA-binding transcriptional MerR regulator